MSLTRREAAERERVTPWQLAQLFHEHYERLAVQFGYTTRADSRVEWADVPAPNKALMIATAEAVLRALTTTGSRER